jgi:putative ATP-binding cassette transporter
MSRTKKLSAFTNSYSQAAVIFPYVLVAPAYFAQKVQLGGMMQTASAFGSVQEALSFFVSVYRTLAEWQAVVARLAGFEASIEAVEALAARPDLIKVDAVDRDAIGLNGLSVDLPDRTPLLAIDGIELRAAESALITGPSGSGKSTLFRAIAGIWPFGTGQVTTPDGARLMMLPQRPYFPVGALDVAVAYPAPNGTFSDAQITEAIAAVGLPALASRVTEHAHWNRMLSLGEQQRLGVARALLHQPDFLFLDEATASLDEPSEAALYRLLAERLVKTTIISIGHRSTLNAFHQRNLTLARDGDRFTLREPVGQPA